MKVLPSFHYEKIAWRNGLRTVAGADEVGRGAFAGPIVTAAVIFPQNHKFKYSILKKIDDSKRLSVKAREVMAKAIMEEVLCYSINEMPLETINREGIGKAAQKSFKKSLDALCHKYDFLLVDAFVVDGIDVLVQKPLIHGDRLSISIAAASILAKVYRDERMKELHSIYPEYGLDKNMGYGTAYHRKQIGKFGLSKIHRSSFNLQRYSKPTA